MEEVMPKYEEWTKSKNITPTEEFLAAYGKALDALFKRVPFEEKISESGTSSTPDYTKLDAWREVCYHNANNNFVVHKL